MMALVFAPILVLHLISLAGPADGAGSAVAPAGAVGHAPARG